MNKINIISGKWKGKKIYVIKNKNLRPTMNFIRENLFNWLSKKIYMLKCLDCYAGSGALSFEALSRNALSSTLIENNLKIFQQLKKNSLLLQAKNSILIYKNTLDYLSKSGKKYDLIFIDPPFSNKNILIKKTCFLLENNNWLEKNALIYIEYKSISTKIILPKNWFLYRKKKLSIVNYELYIRNNT
ncbi:16S rRNA (guanine(966)-N(2))-methyltransferase RsmD [Enterobacteriaceae endosymbiont of Plateumaris sericea]|uniref:16S rRNA (guanine(966)-N(2))-methyltransferase RsmD n=1 Tax=Enterobacteriaceae endosymbiont of Plateumaris sericea TaxID=2675797 RepID=UPI001448B005|nr:16S rRNA (guanine(966)-N(2))-methyltransferase RsmD [Enterobacteriaceae endosymbiont of Plateumaris sericea]QJC29788.1 16S rRNA (guanine(966)-N(2))-methyltransferase RsmD [Enterobacteriaceae endosymbiont of Plateumaris sericea]